MVVEPLTLGLQLGVLKTSRMELRHSLTSRMRGRSCGVACRSVAGERIALIKAKGSPSTSAGASFVVQPPAPSTNIVTSVMKSYSSRAFFVRRADRSADAVKPAEEFERLPM